MPEPSRSHPSARTGLTHKMLHNKISWRKPDTDSRTITLLQSSPPPVPRQAEPRSHSPAPPGMATQTEPHLGALVPPHCSPHHSWRRQRQTNHPWPVQGRALRLSCWHGCFKDLQRTAQNFWSALCSVSSQCLCEVMVSTSCKETQSLTCILAPYSH